MNANTGLKVPPKVKADFDACMEFYPENEREDCKHQFRDVVKEFGIDYAAKWIAGWRLMLETFGDVVLQHAAQKMAKAA